MNMRAILLNAAIAFAIVAAGCDSMKSWIRDSQKAGQVATPELKPASVEAAKRVHKTGQQLLAANTALGLEVTFQTVGMVEPEIFHPDSHGVFITEGLVNLCSSDEQLAAVLATELGKMVSESRTRERMRLPDPIPAGAAGPKLDGSTDYDPGRAMELAYYDKQARKPSDKLNSPSTNPKAITEAILKDAGYETARINEVTPISKDAKRNHALAKQFGGAPDVPHWSR